MDYGILQKRSARGLTSSSLVEYSNRRILQDVIAEQIKTIDLSIKTAHKAGSDYIEYELPTNFTINNMSKSEAQTMVFSELLTIFTTDEKDGGKGFPQTRIKIDANPILFIKWKNGIDSDEIKSRLDTIKKFRVM